MSRALFYNFDGPRLGWVHWKPGQLEEPPRDLPPTHIQPLLTDPAEAIATYWQEYKQTRQALGVAVLQFSSRIAVAEDDLEMLTRRADRAGLEVELGTASIRPSLPDWPTHVRLGYLQQDQGAAYPESSNMVSGLERGDCLLVRRAATIYGWQPLGIPAQPDVSSRQGTDLDALYRYGEFEDWVPYRVVRPDQVVQARDVNRG